MRKFTKSAVASIVLVAVAALGAPANAAAPQISYKIGNGWCC